MSPSPNRSRLRAFALSILSLATMGVGAHALVACASDASAPGATSSRDAGFDSDAAVSTPPCRRSDDCASHNHICVFGSDPTIGSCQTPPDEGRCAPRSDDALDNPECYPGARCQPVPTTQSTTGGLCSFQAPQAPLFELPSTAPKFSATSPSTLTVLRPTDGVQLRWTPPSIPADAITVAVIFRNVPQRVGQTNRIANPGDLLWVWSSTDPGSSTRPGVVALEAGHRGITANGEMGPRFGTNQLPAGRYWWFVYALRNGTVLSTSSVLPFRVGSEFASVPCQNVDDCTRQIPGELPDTVSCIANRCRRRCASNLDCPVLGSTCDLATTLAAPDVRRGAFCTVTQ